MRPANHAKTLLVISFLSAFLYLLSGCASIGSPRPADAAGEHAEISYQWKLSEDSEISNNAYTASYFAVIDTYLEKRGYMHADADENGNGAGAADIVMVLSVKAVSIPEKGRKFYPDYDPVERETAWLHPKDEERPAIQVVLRALHGRDFRDFELQTELWRAVWQLPVAEGDRDRGLDDLMAEFFPYMILDERCSILPVPEGSAALPGFTSKESDS